MRHTAPARSSRRVKSATVRPFPVPAPEEAVDALRDPSLYINRELSLLEFQRRVLEEAMDPGNPLLERVKFLAIVSSNLDEFFMVRVAGLMHQVDAGILDVGPDGMPPREQLDAIRDVVMTLCAQQEDHFEEELRPALAKAGIEILDYTDLTEAQRGRADAYFQHSVFPVLTPLAFDPGRPFPHISNLSLNFAVSIRDHRGIDQFARLKVPHTLQQLVPVHAQQDGKTRAGKPHACVWLEQLIRANLASLFPGMEVVQAHVFHVTRDAEMAIQELEAADLLETIEEGVRQRRFNSVVRLKVNEEMPGSLLDILVNNLEVERWQVYRQKSNLSLGRLMALAALDRPDLKDLAFLPRVHPALDPKTEEDLFAAFRRGDILLHHPFDSFQPVVDFLRQAARDPQVLAIKMTLYRVGRNSPVVEALLDAMEHGKEVAVLVELKARFDEESNIEWARQLERQGVHVVYGLVGLKIHSKVALVVRREGKVIRRYVHLATGNYNPVTAHLYTDLGLFTADEQIGADATDLFNYLTGYSAKRDYRKLLVAPINLRSCLETLVRREIEHQRNGRSGHLVLKTNALVDGRMIRLLYEASQAGVQVDLIVRGICCLRPGVPGVSENIRVRSIVGRFLEHSRIYYFKNGGAPEIYAGSADLMPRNIDRRVEVLFPVTDEAMVSHLVEVVLRAYLTDNVKARHLESSGRYSRGAGSPGEEPVDCQASLVGPAGARAG
ncbi:MAG: polyphosphate kinase 1 [Bryobacterales bacterium]|nr:polyphosphate kinase 1 [Bryobacterales bacterium]